MANILKPAVVLLVICLAVGLCLSIADSMTKDIIADRYKLDAEKKRKEVLDTAESFELLIGWEDKNDTGLIKEVYSGLASGQKKGYVFVVSPEGYAGNIEITVGVSIDGNVTQIKLGENKETPGLGTKAAEPAFADQYIKKGIFDKLELVKRKPSTDHEIQAISGATITSKAVTNGVQAAADLAKELIKEEANTK